MDKTELTALIDRINTRDAHFTISTETTSWKALREAETLTDPALFPLLREIVAENSGRGTAKKEVRTAAYFIYGRLMEKTFQPEECAFFLQRLAVETDKYVLSSILQRIADWQRKLKIFLPAELDFSPILALTKSESHSVRHDAILALSACPGAESREALAFYLTQQDEKKYQYAIYYANIAMQSIGELEDIPLLERFLKSRRPDLKITAQYAIQYIKERAGAVSTETV